MYETGSVKVGGKFQPTTEAPLADASRIEGGPQISEFDTPSLDANIPMRVRAEGQLVISPSTGEMRRFAEDKTALLPARVGSEVVHSVPKLGDDRFTTSLTFSSSGELLARDSEPSYRVPAIGSLRAQNVTVNDDGFAYWVDAERSLRVPRLGDAVMVLYGDDDEALVVMSDPVLGNSGSGSPDLDAGFEVASVSGTVTGRMTRQLMMQRAAETWVQLTLGPDGIDEVISLDPANGKATVAKDGNERVVTWRVVALVDSNRVHLVLVMGQSLAIGFVDIDDVDDTNVPWRDPVHERVWQFKSADGFQRGPRPTPYRTSSGDKDLVIPDEAFAFLEPLRGSAHKNSRTPGQTCAETATAMLAGQCLDHHDHVIGCVIGTGTTSIVDFIPGSEHMQSAEKAIEAAYAWGREMNLLDLTVWFVWNQGGEDILGGMTKATYKSHFISIRDHFEAFVESHTPSPLIDAVFGGAIIQQCEFRTGPGVSTPSQVTLAHAERIEEGEAGGLVSYAFSPGRTGVHYWPRTYFPLGAATGYEIARGIEAGNTQPVPVHVPNGNATLVNATTIDCQFTGGNGSYQFDTTQIANFPDGNYGLSVKDDLGDVGINSVVWQNATTIRITTSRSTLISDSPIVGLGMVGTSYNGLGDPDFLRVNIRDTSGWACPVTGQIVSGWAILQQVAVTA
ncbi:MAG: hypothetical protein AcusKO_29250 [Acuticoccus sp.]